MAVEDVLALLRDRRPFLNGLTLSGGEATLQAAFVEAPFRADPALDGLTCLIDSNGHLGAEGRRRRLPVADGAMLDVKAFDTALHRALTGRDNARSLASVRLVHAAGKLGELRFLPIPGRTDSASEVAALAAFARALGGPARVRLNALRPYDRRRAGRRCRARAPRPWPPACAPRGWAGPRAVGLRLTAAADRPAA
jgi:pyruvate-formate lyase-activating enzyme